jgi:hypothetical protein
MKGGSARTASSLAADGGTEEGLGRAGGCGGTRMVRAGRTAAGQQGSAGGWADAAAEWRPRLGLLERIRRGTVWCCEVRFSKAWRRGAGMEALATQLRGNERKRKGRFRLGREAHFTTSRPNCPNLCARTLGGRAPLLARCLGGSRTQPCRARR